MDPGHIEGHPCGPVQWVLACECLDLDQNQHDHGCSHHLQLRLKWLAAAWVLLRGRGRLQVQERVQARQVLEHEKAGVGLQCHRLAAPSVLLAGAHGQSHYGVLVLPQQCAAVVLRAGRVEGALLV